MAKTHEDRLQEAIEDALDDRAVLLMPDWRHPITAVSALHKLIKARQRQAFDEGVAEGSDYQRGALENDQIVNPYEEE